MGVQISYVHNSLQLVQLVHGKLLCMTGVTAIVTVTLIVPKSALGPQDEIITFSVCLAVIRTQT